MGLSDFLGSLAHGAIRSIPGVGGMLDAGITGLQHNGDGQGGFLQGAKDFLGDHGGDLLLGGQIVNSAINQKQSGDAMGHALDAVNGQYKTAAPLREQGMAGMLNPGLGIAAKIGAIPQGANPYAPQPAPASPPPQGPALGPAKMGGQ